MRTRYLVAGLTLCLTTLTTTATAAAAADYEIHTATNTKTTAQLDAYWTPERIRNAKPVEAPVVPASTIQQRAGEPISVPGSAPVTRGLNETTGRLLFSANGGDYICTATVVASNNKSVIATARHCGFNDGGTNYRYAPNYSGGNTPHGWWDWKTAGWVSGGDGITDDVAFIVLNQKDGRPVGDVVGTNGIAFNQPIDQYAYLVGIPGDKDVVFRCEAQAYAGPQNQQLMDNCDGMSGGASGGSWNVNPQPDGWAYQTGTYFGSYGSAAAGSRFGDVAYEVWNGAQNA
jgi:hypothetical protein